MNPVVFHQPLSTVTLTVFAHQGGWDEALLVATPLALIGLLLWVANRRVSAQLAATTADEEPGSGDTDSDVGP